MACKLRDAVCSTYLSAPNGTFFPLIAADVVALVYLSDSDDTRNIFSE